jgi:hypothetical protein
VPPTQDHAGGGWSSSAITIHDVPACTHHLEIPMKSFTLFRAAAVALAMTAVGSAALADGDIYSRLFEMKQMDRNKDGMVSKDEFLAMVAKAWDMQAADMKVVGHKMTAEQIKELEKILGRTLSAQSGT